MFVDAIIIILFFYVFTSLVDLIVRTGQHLDILFKTLFSVVLVMFCRFVYVVYVDLFEASISFLFLKALDVLIMIILSVGVFLFLHFIKNKLDEK